MCGAFSLQNLPLESRLYGLPPAIPTTETRKAEGGEGERRRKVAGRLVNEGWGVDKKRLQRFGGAKETQINQHASPMRGRGPVLFEWRTVRISPFNLQSNFVSRISPSYVIQIWWFFSEFF
jgi:hypothetical protein